MTNPSKVWRLPLPVFAADDALAADVVMDEGADVDKTGVDKVADKSGDKSAAADVVVDDKAEDKTAEADGGADKTTDKDNAGDDKVDEGADKAPSIALTDDIRDLIAGNDPALRKLLGRYSSFKTMAQALKNSQATISAGKLKGAVSDEPMPDAEADPDGAKEWRKARGVPDDPTGYVLSDEVTKRLVDEDKPVLASFTEFAHAKGARPDVVAIGTEWYVSQVEAMAAAEANADKEAGSTAEESLRGDWGREYKGNINVAHRFISAIPGLGTDFAVARGPDGRRLVDKPEFVLWAAEQGRAMFGDSDFANDEGEARHVNRRTEIEKIRDTDFDRYEREGLNKELHDLIEKDLKRGKR
jgi:hypothetical protein